MKRATISQWLNLLAPGAGVALLGPVWLGVAVGLIFIVLLNAAIVAIGWVPDEIGLRARKLLVLGAAIAYILAQLAMSRAARRYEHTTAAALRREALQAALEALAGGNGEAALLALQPLRSADPDDLHIALRVAQALSAGNSPDAAVAWEHLRRLDRHHIYRDFAPAAQGRDQRQSLP